MILSDPPIFFGYGSLTKKVQQTKTLCLISFTNNKFFFKCDGLTYNLTITIRLFPPKRETIRKQYFVPQVPKTCDPILFWLERQTNNLNCSTQRIHVMILFSRQNRVVMPASLLLWARARFSQRIIMNALCVSCLVNFVVNKVKKPDWLMQLITFSPCTYYI